MIATCGTMAVYSSRNVRIGSAAADPAGQHRRLTGPSLPPGRSTDDPVRPPKARRRATAALRPRGVFAGTRGPEPPCPRCDAPRRDVDAAHDVGRPVECDGRERADREADLGGARPAPRVVPVDVDQKRGDLGRLSEAPVRWRRSRLSRGTSRGEPTRRRRLGHRVQAGAGGEILRRPRTAVEGDDRLAPPGFTPYNRPVNIARTKVRGSQRKEPVLEPESLALRFQVDGSSARLAAR